MKNFYRISALYLIVFLSVSVLNAAAGKYPKSTHAFPPLYDFDNYDACLNSGASKLESTFCIVYAEIQPQNSSKLWQQIAQHIGEFKFHYRRDRLFFGVCIERCKNYPKILDNFLHNDSRISNQITEYFEAIHKRPVDLQMRSEYHELVYNCLNSEFEKKYGLGLKTYIEYCERPEETMEQDGGEKMMYKVLEIILILNILSSLYDSCLKRKQPAELQNSNFYKTNPQQPVSRLLTSFSIRRNYYRLVEPYASQLGKDLSYLDGIRSFCLIIVIIGHAYFVQYHHVKNPDTFENFAKMSLHLFFTNGTLILEVFHVLSGFLLLIKFNDLFRITPQSSAKDCLKTFCKGMLSRYMRFIPSFALFIFVNATFLTRLQDGPFWRHLTEPGRTLSREKWLKNLLNFNNTWDSGYPHTWYMTTDLQLFALYFCIVIAIKKFPNYKKKILTSLAFLAVFIPFTVCYVYSLDPCYLIGPETFRYRLNMDELFAKLYIPFYTNLGGYLFGIVCGEIYEKYGHDEELHKQISRVPGKLFEIAFWLAIAFGIWICWLGAVIIFKEPSIWTALYGGLNRNVWLLVVCSALVLLGMFYKSLSPAAFFSHSAFRILARLSFQIYLWHFSILHLINGSKRELIYTNHLQHFILITSLFLLSSILAFVITIFVEYPFQQVAHYYHKTGRPSKSHHLKS